MKTFLLASRRGQTLLLFSLMMLILVLMVCLTLSTGMKVKEKMEVQTVADAAAFSNATATARTFNEIALMQRAEIGQMVAMASTQSLISFAGYYRSEIEATRKGYGEVIDGYKIITAACCIPSSPCTALCKCATKAIQDANKTISDLQTYQNKLKTKWDSLDQAAGAQSIGLQGLAGDMNREHQVKRLEHLRDKVLDKQTLAGEVVKAASKGSKWSDEWSAHPSAVTSINVGDELGVIKPREFLKHHLGAAMGSRGFSFVTTRSGGGALLARALNEELPKPDYVTMTDRGSAWWGPSNNHGGSMSGKASWADDHGDATVFFLRNEAPCPPMFGDGDAKKSYVHSTDQQDTGDEHVWDPGSDSEGAQTRHTMGTCNDCPGIWPGFLDYEETRITNGDNLFGQPKNYALIQRDYETRGENADPWNLLFRFRFTPSAVKFDNNGIRLTSPEGGDVNISKQTALSAGLAYYHRQGYWQETPNFFNPFWRATLVPATIDNKDGKDVTKALNSAGVKWAAEAYKELNSKGYKGGP